VGVKIKVLEATGTHYQRVSLKAQALRIKTTNRESNTMPNTLFISDLHLCDSKPQSTERFLQFLNNEARSAEALYILGDFFEAWIGDDCDTPVAITVQQALREFTQSTQIPTYFMHGNRDFLISQAFCQKTGVQLISDPSPVTLYGKQVLLTHGDFLCIDDKRYQRLRKLTSNRWLKKIFMYLPKKRRETIAKNGRKKSQTIQQSSPQYNADINLNYAKKHCEKHQCRFLIHGHTHQPQLNYLSEQKHIYRMTLSSWDDKPGYGLVNVDGFELHYFTH
jgi:UDP-2,3-diacylglucosamine hydrolase